MQVFSPKKTGTKIPAGSPLPAGTMVDEEVESIPAKFNTQTTLERDLKGGKNELDFDLLSK